LADAQLYLMILCEFPSQLLFLEVLRRPIEFTVHLPSHPVTAQFVRDLGSVGSARPWIPRLARA
jgi:hypothetical protein